MTVKGTPLVYRKTWPRFWPPRLALAVAWCAWLTAAAIAPRAQAGEPDPPADPLAALGIHVTKGAAAGYVPDKACATCHAEMYQSYQHVGMAKSFARPAEADIIEDFGKTFYHAPSKRYYQIRKDGESLVFRRYQRDGEGKPINAFETEIDWVMGSGNRARSYLYQTEWGELYMLPLGWYSEDKTWGMSPGFEDKKHPGLLRRAQRQCMFCHNGFAEVPEDSDWSWQTHRFPEDLPQGTGCQRCHGPGAAHIRAAVAGQAVEIVRGHMVNPRKLPPEQRDSVCFQCHMLPTVSIIGTRRFDRPDYSFRPGQRLTDYLVHVDIDQANLKRADRFEINHHGYRLWRSPCYQESKGELSCISCHDPHVKPASKDFRAKVAEVCGGCHQEQVASHQPDLTASRDCVACHMPTRRTRDVVLVTMTDHRIARGPFDHDELVKPIAAHEPVITDVGVLPWGDPPSGVEAEIYRVSSVLRALATADGVAALKKLLMDSRYPALAPYLQLLDSQLQLKDFAGAKETATFLLGRRDDLFYVYGSLGVALAGLGESEAAMASLRKSLALEATPEAHVNLALVAFKEKRHDLALAQIEAAIALRPTYYAAWMIKGRIYARLGKLKEARDALIRSLQLEPGNTDAYTELIPVLRQLGENARAESYLSLGRRVSWQPRQLKALRKRR